MIFKGKIFILKYNSRKADNVAGHIIRDTLGLGVSQVYIQIAIFWLQLSIQPYHYFL
jgi:hypothetical protein